nr:PREDICTED: acid sphingomyelinase-like phosphodiesterase 3b [Latimeria chalumnae]|eukprot:XP_006005448.1 PREDICTED: acid sphingomyelinase-like phosphodiesterase 3b [Latimeria chalumnae]
MEAIRRHLNSVVCVYLAINTRDCYFWHFTDLHLDPNYNVSSNPLAVCPSAGSQPVKNAGKWGHYLCDSPLDLINSSIYAMKEILHNPDFILWTGDDTPHISDKVLGEEAVLKIIGNVTKMIRQAFPDTKVYSALGNHDFHPKNQLPPSNHTTYDKIAELWKPWLNNDSIPMFKKGAFYTEKLLKKSGQRVVVLNTNLYYESNKATAGMKDPGNQFEWLENVLANASTAGEKVMRSV